jgi:hypothetical protein
VGLGEVPLTEQFSSIVPAKPPCAVNVNASLTCPPRFRLRLDVAGVTEKSPIELFEVNEAVNDLLVSMVIEQVPVPEQGPPQPENVEPELGEAVNLTLVPAGKLAMQEPPQSIPGTAR